LPAKYLIEKLSKICQFLTRCASLRAGLRQHGNVFLFADPRAYARGYRYAAASRLGAMASVVHRQIVQIISVSLW